MQYYLHDATPQIAPDSYIAPSAELIGKITVEAEASVWFNTTLRGDNEPITIGARSNVQDNSVLHTDPGFPLIIGEGVTIGHSVILHGTQIKDGCLIGMGSILMNGVQLGERCLVGAGTLITENQVFEPESLIIGRPGKRIRALNKKELAALAEAATIYTNKIPRYLEHLGRADFKSRGEE